MRALKFIPVLVFVLIMRTTSSAQNLVPNPSFEDTISCPTYISQLNRTEFWFNPTGNSPDYFNECYDTVANTSADVPMNWLGTQYARTGKAYAGVIALYSTANGREYISIKLKDTLTIGHRYCVEFFVSLSDSSYVGVSHLGAHISATPDTIYCLPCPINFLTNLPFQPQIKYDSIVTDTMGWTKISGSFIANGNECYMTIGVFRPDSLLSMDTIRGDGSNVQSYYYIDDVAVWDCDTPATVYPEIIFFPNPSNGNFSISGNFPLESELKIYNLLGQQVSNTISLPEGNQNVPIYSFLAAGVYCCRIEAQGVILKSEMIVVSE